MEVEDLIKMLMELDPKQKLDKVYLETEPGNFLELKVPEIDSVGDLIFQPGK